MRHTENKYGISIVWLLLIATVVAGCTTNEDLLSPDKEGGTEMTLLVEKTRAAKVSAIDASSTEEDILEYLRTFNGEFEVGSKIRLVNNQIGKVPNYKVLEKGTSSGHNGYFEYYCAEDDTTSDGFYKFKPSIPEHKLYWADNTKTGDPNAIFTTGSYYAFNALYYWAYESDGASGFDEIGIDESTGSVYGHVLEDQSSEKRFRACDIMQAHHLKDFKSQRGEVIKLRFWHQLAMLVINVNVPKETFGVGFTSSQMQEAVCTLTDFYCGFYLPYDLDFASDGYMATNHIGAPYEKTTNITMWPVGGVREYADAEGVKLVRTYAALVPNQIKKDERLCRFRVNNKNYTYTPKGNVELWQTNMTIIDLRINPGITEPILLNARILPWGNAYVPDFPLYPEKESNN